MPETNFTGYKFKDRGGIANKYSNNNIAGIGLGSGGSLLAHKYGSGSASNSMSVHNENNNEKFGNSASKNMNYYEEELPRALAQPQSQIVRK